MMITVMMTNIAKIAENRLHVLHQEADHSQVDHPHVKGVVVRTLSFIMVDREA
jgi:hypothetical protein